jgi:signal peptidase I
MPRRILICLLTLVILTSIGLTVSLTSSGYYPSFLVGGSMGPTIPNFSLVVFRAPEDIEIGQVVVFNYWSYVEKVTEESVIDSQEYKEAVNNLTIHRIIAQDEENFVTKGDNNDREDLLPIRKEDILGVSVYHNLFLSYICFFSLGILFAVLIVIAVKNFLGGVKRMGKI